MDTVLAAALGASAPGCEAEQECPDSARDGKFTATREPARHDEGGESCDAPIELGPATETTCPSESTLTYESFGREFMEHYCVRCHSSQLAGDARRGAPPYHDFDSLDGILVVIDHIDMTAAVGPAAMNELMPPSTPAPSLDERVQLGEWLACELAAM
jgi:hypothetical protein